MEFSLRPSEAADETFLRQLNRLAYEPVVVAQFGAWDLAKQKEFFDAKWQSQKYLLIIADGAPVGAVSSLSEEGALKLMELLVLPEQQNRGIGTDVVQQLQERARRQQMPLLLQVLTHNRGARRLYERLGFRVYETTETHHRMRWDGDVSG